MGQNSPDIRISANFEGRCQVPHALFSRPRFGKLTWSYAVGRGSRQESWECVCAKSDQEEASGVFQAESVEDASRYRRNIYSTPGSRHAEYYPSYVRVGQIFHNKAVSPVGTFLVALIRSYQLLLSPLFPSSCRFFPTCSEYAKEAVVAHGVLKGSWLVFRRLLKCRPFGPGGYDPVP